MELWEKALTLVLSESWKERRKRARQKKMWTEIMVENRVEALIYGFKKIRNCKEDKSKQIHTNTHYSQTSEN